MTKESQYGIEEIMPRRANSYLFIFELTKEMKSHIIEKSVFEITDMYRELI